jgi:hypothetical protein
MTELPSFGAVLARLSEHRRLDIHALSQAAAVPEPDLAAVLTGAAPSESLLRRLAPALHLHTSDLFVMAGLTVPEDLAPLDAKAGQAIYRIVATVDRGPDQVRRLREFVRTLPQQPRTQPPPPPPAHHRYQPGPGAVVLRLLHNRNLNWLASAYLLASTNVELYWSGSTVGLVGHGKKALTPDIVTGFAAVLGIRPVDLAAVTGVDLPAGTWTPPAVAAEFAELVWDVRRLTADQMHEVHGRARAMTA